jgi:hypothetical protein
MHERQPFVNPDRSALQRKDNRAKEPLPPRISTDSKPVAPDFFTVEKVTSTEYRRLIRPPWSVMFDEYAGVMEYIQNNSRERAEQLAFEYVRRLPDVPLWTEYEAGILKLLREMAERPNR